MNTGLTISGLRTFFRIASEWGLCVDDQCRLLGVQPATLVKWSKAPPVALPRDTLERIGYVLGIYKALRILLPTPMSSRQWLHQPNSAPSFAGCVFRRSRAGIPIHAGPPFRFMPGR
jgi:hypothetical protein